jgi:hypothetical protein
MMTWMLAALSGAACLGCTASGTFDNIPKRPVVESTGTSFNGPTPAGNTSSSTSNGCPPRSASGVCPFERVQCAFDDHGCEVCTCSAP